MKFTRTLLASAAVALLAACSNGANNPAENPAPSTTAPSQSMAPATPPAATPANNGSSMMPPAQSGSSMMPPAESASSMPANQSSSAAAWDKAKTSAKEAASHTGDAIKNGAKAVADKTRETAHKAKDAMSGGH